MSKFIKLTNLIINTNNIHAIIRKPDKFTIQIVSKSFDGFSWSIAGFGWGNISSFTSDIEVYKNEHSIDYKIVSDWIDNH
jgi:hypothetical protein